MSSNLSIPGLDSLPELGDINQRLAQLSVSSCLQAEAIFGMKYSRIYHPVTSGPKAFDVSSSL